MSDVFPQDVSYTKQGDMHQIRWRQEGLEFGMESEDLQRLIRAVLFAVAQRAAWKA